MNNNQVIDTLNASIAKLRHTPLKHLPITTSSHGAYFRSKLFNNLNNLNPLISAANSLLLCIANLQDKKTSLPPHELFEKLIHETKAFETQAQTLGYRTETILIARYILCATLDEKILPGNWGEESAWYKYKLLSYFHDEDSGAERFFLILDRLSNEPKFYIDLLELIYLCLNLGFRGKYQHVENGKYELDKILENLYNAIRWQRGEIKKELLIREESSSPSNKKTNTQPLPFIITCLLACVLLFTLFIGFNIVAGISITPLYHQLNNITHTL